MVWWYDGTLKQQWNCFLISSVPFPIFYWIIYFLCQSVFYKSISSSTSSSNSVKTETTHHIFCSKFFRQSCKWFDGLLLTLAIHGCIPRLVFKILLCHSTKVMFLTSKLDIDNQFSQSLIYLVSASQSWCWAEGCRSIVLPKQSQSCVRSPSFSKPMVYQYRCSSR